MIASVSAFIRIYMTRYADERDERMTINLTERTYIGGGIMRASLLSLLEGHHLSIGLLSLQCRCSRIIGQV